MLDFRAICIGDELLCGNTLNTNFHFLGGRLAACGYRITAERCIPDTREAILETLAGCRGAQAVFLIGGLGPTQDDMTRPTVAEFLKRPLQFHPEIEQRIITYLGDRAQRINPQAFRVQSMVPEGATPLLNNNGTAPGLMLSVDGTTYILMPGPPREMRPMFDQQVLPAIQKLYPPEWAEQSLHVVGVGESIAENLVLETLAEEGKRLHLAYCIKEDNVEIRLGAPAGSQEEALIAPALQKLKAAFGPKELPETCQNSVQYLAQLLLERKYTVSTAESCTGGGIAARFTDLPGSSQWFHGAFVTYSNEWKEKILGVSPETLQKHGAVSAETVHEMLRGVFAHSDADLAIAVSGIAGPDGGTPDKPVGTVYIGVADRGANWENVQLFHFNGLRDTVRSRTATNAVTMLIQHLTE